MSNVSSVVFILERDMVDTNVGFLDSLFQSVSNGSCSNYTATCSDNFAVLFFGTGMEDKRVFWQRLLNGDLISLPIRLGISTSSNNNGGAVLVSVDLEVDTIKTMFNSGQHQF
ncbi:hypothetical protein OGATHE_004564 [Ogataea polymorpha]|uniref:Uncharacterized protein n=1 Tax=Ogataea polymorpha TaxID=460523 RepID=A0A9P8T1N1_9ASCO|nr:hypothetical protein OGATHE_004564 [Ogataea polymorpha]